MDPFVLTGVRFALAAIPLVFFIRRPSVPFGYVAAYGLIFGVGMWGAINYGIAAGVAPGIASLIIQLSAFFTMFWGALLFRETLRPAQWIGAIVVLFGLAGIFLAQNGAHQIFGIALIVVSAIAWSIGNVIIKKSGVKEIFSFMVWASLFPPVPLLLGTWWLEGGASIRDELAKHRRCGLVLAGVPGVPRDSFFVLGLELADEAVPGFDSRAIVADDSCLRHFHLHVPDRGAASSGGAGIDRGDYRGPCYWDIQMRQCAGGCEAGFPIRIKGMTQPYKVHFPARYGGETVTLEL